MICNHIKRAKKEILTLVKNLASKDKMHDDIEFVDVDKFSEIAKQLEKRIFITTNKKLLDEANREILNRKTNKKVIAQFALTDRLHYIYKILDQCDCYNDLKIVLEEIKQAKEEILELIRNLVNKDRKIHNMGTNVVVDDIDEIFNYFKEKKISLTESRKKILNKVVEKILSRATDKYIIDEVALNAYLGDIYKLLEQCDYYDEAQTILSMIQKERQCLEKTLTNEEKEITDLRVQIANKQDEINSEEEKSKNLHLSEEERTELEKEINNLKAQLNDLQTQLSERDKELKNLSQENNQLIADCLNYLALFKSFHTKQKQLTELKVNLTKKIPSEEELDRLCQLREEFTPLESEVEDLILNEQQRTNLISRLKLQNNQIDSITSEINNKFGVTSQEKTFTNLEKIAEKAIGECNERVIKTVLLSNNSELQSLKNVHEQVSIQDQERIKKMFIFLNAKQTFITTRQGTIERLQECCNKLEKFIELGGYAITKQVGEGIINIGGATSKVDFNITQTIGKVIAPSNELLRINRNNKYIKKFNQYLTSDKNKMFWFNDHYNSLLDSTCNDYEGEISPIIIKVLKLTRGKESPFISEYDVFKVIKKDMNVWENKSYLTLEEMKGWIKELDKNLDKFKEELNTEEAEYYQRIIQLEKELSNQQQIQVPPK